MVATRQCLSNLLRMAFGTSPGVESRDGVRASPVSERVAIRKSTRPAMEGNMNPLDSITGTIVSGVILALILAALF